MPPRATPARFFRTPAEFRKWLERNHARVDELWVGFWKRDTGKPSLTWPQSVDEALCFGWIDGLRKSIDVESYKIRFTPRRARSIWSKVNVRRVEVLSAEGRMHPNGLAAFERRDATGAYSFEQADRQGLTPKYEGLMKKNREAWEFFQAQPPGYRKTAGWFVMSARQEETRLRRLDVLIRDSAAGRRIGILNPKRSPGR